MAAERMDRKTVRTLVHRGRHDDGPRHVELYRRHTVPADLRAYASVPPMNES